MTKKWCGKLLEVILMKWTNDQLKAIKTRGGKVIVSAAAGSGKTAVLSARIEDYILNGGSIDKLLVVTFTTLAAGEMKERIKKNINQTLIKDPSNKHLQQQSLLVEQASIMTMDAFYNKLIKENFMHLKISPNFKIIDEIEYKVIKEKTALEVVENIVKNNCYVELIDNFYNIKDGSVIEELIIKFDDFINKIPNPNEWLKSLENIYESKDFNSTIWSELFYNDILMNFKYYESLYENILEEIKLDDVLFDKLYSFTIDEINFIVKIIDEIENKNILNLSKLIKTYNPKNYPRITGYAMHPTSLKFKQFRDTFKSDVKYYSEILNKYNTYYEDMELINLIMSQLIDVVKLYRQKLEDIRYKNNFYSFDDVPHLVLKLLINKYDHKTGVLQKTNIAKELESAFDEILIDEYQDTNLVQNLIFNALSKNGNNLFIVGDVKQSIYGFRSARPDLLIEETRRASTNNFPALINLSKNFRSRDEVLSFSNYLFSKIMSLNFGDISYDEKEALYLGAQYKENDTNNVELHLLTELTENEEGSKLTNIEQEAIYITNVIKNLFMENYQVFDAKTQSYRNLRKNDIAILLRSTGDINILRDILTKNGLDVYTEKTPIYFNNYEVKLIISLLKIINNPYDEISLVSVLRSPLFACDPDLLLEIRLFNNNGNLYNNLLKMKNNSLINNFFETLVDFKEKSKILSISKLLNYIYNKTKIMAIISSMENHIEREKNLLEMINHANKYTNDNPYHSLHDFVNYIDTLIENKFSLEGINPASEKDSILITTIHKSKGLEFPIVILPNLNKRFNFTDLYKNVLLDNDYYLAFKLREHDNYKVNDPFIYEIVKKELKNKQLSEELRILYVALTRAKEKLILSGIINNLETEITRINSLIGDENTIVASYLKKANSMFDFILPVVIKHYKNKELRELANIDTKLYNDYIKFELFIKDTNEIKHTENNVIIENNYSFDEEKVKYSLNYKYPYTFNKIRQKLSVSDINDSFEYISTPKFIDEKKQLKVGTIYHNILEHIKFKNYNFNEFDDEIQLLIHRGKIKQDEIKLVNLAKIYNFFKDPIYLNKIMGSKYKKEYSITFTSKISDINPMIKSNDEVVVDGIIDLVCLLNDEIIIIDYKSDIVDNERELIKRYKKQLDLYEYALSNGNEKITKYIYSFHLSKFIKI